MKKVIVSLIVLTISTSMYSQLSVLKLVGKNSKEHKLGYGAYVSLDYVIGGKANRRIVFEVEFGTFPAKATSNLESAAFGSFKLGYRHIFSEESRTGFFVEPQVGYCMTGIGEYNEELAKGVALAFVTGYSLGVGKQDNSFLFGLKWESDLANNNKQLNTIGFRIAFIYSLFGNRKDSE